MIAVDMCCYRWLRTLALVSALLALSPGCRKSNQSTPADRPRLNPGVMLYDVTFRSAALGRDIQYRVISPVQASPRNFPVVYLLHGSGGGFLDWSNFSDVANFAQSGLVLVMPEGESSYYTNAVDPPQDRFEDYITRDLISDVESRFPVASGRANRAIVGVSMGGFGAVKIALRHPDLFAFAGGISSAIDVPRRAFSWKRFHQSRHYDSIFGSSGSQTRHDNDPFVLARNIDPQAAPYFFLTCGEQEGLLPANHEFAVLLAARDFQFEFHTVRGGHDWNQWNAWLPSVFRSLAEHLQSN
jgi:S-formylglutathione hydrolase FrmB